MPASAESLVQKLRVEELAQTFVAKRFGQVIRTTAQATAANPGDTFVFEIRKMFMRKPIGETLAAKRTSNISNSPSG